MKALILPIMLLVLGTVAGAAAGIFLKPEPAPEDGVGEDEESSQAADDGGEEGREAKSEEKEKEQEENGSREYVKLNNQFIVPVVEEGRVVSMVVLSLTVEALPGGRELVYGREPKLRDAFLQDLFRHANAGGFSGNFTEGVKMKSLSAALRNTAKDLMGDTVTDVFITDIVRQDN